MELHQRTAKYTCQQSSSFNNSSFKNKQTKQQTKIEQTNVICWHKIPLQLYEVNMNNTIFGCCSAPWTNGTFNSLPCFGLFSVHPFPVSGCSVSTPSDKSVPVILGVGWFIAHFPPSDYNDDKRDRTSGHGSTGNGSTKHQITINKQKQ